MLSTENNKLITKVGPGTPMGEAMRLYWIPIMMDFELPHADCDPVRVRVMGENLVAFRDSKGRIGLLPDACPHRRVSLYFGRNEEEGLRCVYHGWKFDVDGDCVDMPNEPVESNFKHKVKMKAYKTWEGGNVIWAYLGPSDRVPPPPKFEWTTVPDSHRGVTKLVQTCNWVQAVEGGIDTSHSSFLHNNDLSDKTLLRSRSTAPYLEVETTNYGYTYSSTRPLSKDEGNYIRTYHYVLPFHQIRAGQVGRSGEAVQPRSSGHCWVPIDDENTMVFNWTFTWDENPLNDKDKALEGTGNEWDVDIDRTTFIAKRNKGNDWLLDRQMQRTQNFTGIVGVNTQDRALQETMGVIADRTQERLGTSDRAIIAMRKLLLEAVKVAGDGGSPKGSQGEFVGIRAIDRILPADQHWTALKPEMYPVGTH
ncbi:MAG: Rieske 2Fe-2S domain-containing protein [SAR202 cluster bacterium]|nr:Rieske 2Fe-2S domain-containing protein [SAR202 cluster bacterium]|tara:strand:- start:8978 stop:10243 length:1266 start_codon:yes stop_codon:yes gene_type:complete